MKTSEKLNRFMVLAGKHDAVWKKYGINSAPTVLFLDPSGKKVGNGGRDSAGLIKQITETAEKYNREPKWASNEESAIATAKEEQKPLVIVYRDDKPKSDAAILEFNAIPVSELYGKAVWVQKTLNLKSDEAKELGITSLPTMWIIDVRVEDPKTRIIKKTGAPKSAAIKSDLAAVLKTWKATEAPKEEPKEEPKE